MIGYSEIEMTEHFVVKTGFCNNAFSKSRGIRIRGDFVLFCGVRLFVGYLSLRFPRRSRARLPASMVFPDELLRLNSEEA